MSKPPWITTSPGRPAAFSPHLSDDERAFVEELERKVREAREFTEGPAAALASDAMRFLADGRRAEICARAQLDLFTQMKDGEKVVYYREQLARALVDQGRFEEAMTLVRNKPGHGPLRFEIKAVAAACERDDDAMCRCEREHAEIDGQQIELDRRHSVRQVYSPKHGKVVNLWKCRCGFRNATEEGPERQRGYDGTRAAVADVGIKQGLPPEASDRRVLKV